MAKFLGNLVWQSKIFPKAVVTDVMVQAFKLAYPNVKFVQPELLKMEAWLVSNPHRVPKSRWGRFINSWMRIANDKKNYEPGSYNGEYSARRKGGNKEKPLSLKEILEKAKEHELPPQ